MIPRALGKQAKQLAQWFPVVSITGPRQSGKSTLAKAMFPDYDYVNLEILRHAKPPLTTRWDSFGSVLPSS